MGQAGHFGVGAFDDALLRFLQRAGDADLLVDADVDLLLGGPAVLMLEDVERGLSVAVGSGLVQGAGSGVPCSPHGNVSSTNASGSSLIVGDHSRAINSISSEAL